MLEAAINATESLDHSVLRDYVASHEFPTVMGTLNWDEAGRPEPSVLLIQWIDGEQEIIWPPDAATTDPVFPMPAWSEK